VFCSASKGDDGHEVFLDHVHYDNRGRLLETQTWSNATGIIGFEHLYYQYAPNSDVTWFSDGLTGIFTYAYDDFNRLKSSVISPYLQVGPYFGYAYDRYGSRWQQTAGSALGSGTCTAGNSVCVSFNEGHGRRCPRPVSGRLCSHLPLQRAAGCSFHWGPGPQATTHSPL